MTDVNPNPNPDENDDVEVPDEVAAESVNLADFGITDEISEENLVNLYTLFNDKLDVVIAASEAAKEAAKSDTATDPKSVAKKQVAAVPADENLEMVLSNFLDRLFDVIDADPGMAAPALNGLSSVTKFVSDVRDTEVFRRTAEIKSDRGEDPDSVDPDDDAAMAKQIAKAARNMLTKLIMVAPLIRKPIPASIPVKKNAAGDTVPDLTDLPKGRSAVNTPNLGRGAKARKVRYSFQPTGSTEVTDLREGITLAEIAVTVLSKKGYRVLSSDLTAKFGKDGLDQFSETPWEIVYETGTLRGYLPKEN